MVLTYVGITFIGISVIYELFDLDHITLLGGSYLKNSEVASTADQAVVIVVSLVILMTHLVANASVTVVAIDSICLTLVSILIVKMYVSLRGIENEAEFQTGAAETG